MCFLIQAIQRQCFSDLTSLSRTSPISSWRVVDILEHLIFLFSEQIRPINCSQLGPFGLGADLALAFFTTLCISSNVKGCLLNCFDDAGGT